MNASPDQLLDRIAVAVRGNLPPGVTPAYLDGFLARHRPTLVSVIERNLARRQRGQRPQLTEPPAELWTPSKRTAANLAAMRVAASTPPDRLTPADRHTLAGYSGWGGLSITKVKSQFPAGFPAPEVRGLIHEYYTPSKVTDEVARVLRPLLPELSGTNGTVLTLEPSAGIGRFVRSLSGPGFESLHWLTVEWSELSAHMLQAIRPDLAVFNGPFERWVREHGDEYAGRLNLVVANPPYGARGASITEDPNREHREKQSYAYFLRRSLDLLAPNGLGVFLIPSGFFTGSGARNRALRDKVLKRHHLSAAYRLLSGLFPGAQLVVDLLFLRPRGGTLDEVDAGDQFVLEGRYFEDFPAHILGTEVGKDSGDDDHTKKPRWGYQVVGDFTRLPDLVERQVCDACAIRAPAPTTRPAKQTGVARTVADATKGLPPELAAAVRRRPSVPARRAQGAVVGVVARTPTTSPTWHGFCFRSACHGGPERPTVERPGAPLCAQARRPPRGPGPLPLGPRRPRPRPLRPLWRSRARLRTAPLRLRRREVAPVQMPRPFALSHLRRPRHGLGAAHLVDRVLPDVTVRQWVLSIPWPRR